MCSTCLLLCNKPSQIQSFKITIFLISPVCSLGRAQEGNLCTLWCQLGQLEWELEGPPKMAPMHAWQVGAGCLPGPRWTLMWLPECFTERCLGAKSTYAKLRSRNFTRLLQVWARTWLQNFYYVLSVRQSQSIDSKTGM